VPPNVILPADALIHQHTFPNGLVLVAETMPGVQSAAFTLLLPAGAAYEPADRGGAASVLSEWITRGAGDLDSFALLSALDNLGRNLLPALEIFADVVLRPHLDDDEVEPIRALALQNLRSLEDDPGSKVIYELRKRHFPDPWGRPAPGTPEGVAALTPDELRDYFARAYRPNGAILGVAGAIDWPALVSAVGRLFGDWEPRAEPAVTERSAGLNRDHIVRETQQIQIALAYPSATVASPDYYRARAATAILGGYSSARLFTEVREKRGLCYSVYASYESQRDRAAVLCYAGTSVERAQETLDVTAAEIDRLARSGVEPDELDTMRAGLKSSLIMQQESSMSRSGSLASDWFYLARVRTLDEISAALDALTPQSVSEYAAGQDLDAMTILTLGPNALTFPR
jgi:predicted Zn-dependent peptidase